MIYEYRPNGVRASRLPDWQHVLGVPVTSRSWKTVSRLHDLASAPR